MNRQEKYLKKKKEDKLKLLDKWAPILNNPGQSPDWMSQYTDHFKNNEVTFGSGSNHYLGGTISANAFTDTLLPIAMKVAAQTIGQNLVSTQPLGGFGDEKLLKKAEKKVIAVNREKKIDSILDDKKFEPLDIEDTDEYKEYKEQCKGPAGTLLYLDYKYSTPDPSTQRISRKKF